MTPASIWKIRDVSLEQEVEALYSAELTYHNFQHAIDTIRAAEHITTTCIEEGIRVNHRVVYFALLFHDAGFLEDHLALGFSTKEAYSAELAANRLGERGESQITIEKVVAAILSTHKDASFVTVEQKAVRAAALSSLAANYDVFLKNSTDLKAEYELINDTSISRRSWVDSVRKSVQVYLAQEIRLTSDYVNEHGESAFHQAVRQNLERIIVEA